MTAVMRLSAIGACLQSVPARDLMGSDVLRGILLATIAPGVAFRTPEIVHNKRAQSMTIAAKSGGAPDPPLHLGDGCSEMVWCSQTQ